MTERFLEVIFRNKLLLILPIVLGLAGGIFVVSQDTDEVYVSQATIWVERPSDLTGGSFTEFNPYASPAQNQASSMRELLSTKSFITGILDRLDGPPAPGSDHPGYRYDEIRANTGIYPSGTHVLFIQFRADIPEEAMKTIEVIVDEYSKLYLAQIRDRAARAETFYEQQFTEAKATLEKATGELRLYTSTNPAFEDIDLENPPPSALEDLEFARLLAAAQTARENYETVLDRYAESQVSAISASGTNANFTILDQPELPSAPIARTKRSLMLPPVAGLILGVFASSAVFFLRWRLDRSVRLASDLAFLSTDVPIVTLPSLRSRRRRWPKSFVRISTALRSGLRSAQAASSSGPFA